ncbi:hypothetical protein BDY24DRAFT_393998 [Mrakia frigida]|uniref:uncharacterized protein n=1 Tax=Mrakia frigida TaxID=29902 RepID=UPI003FCC014A
MVFCFPFALLFRFVRFVSFRFVSLLVAASLYVDTPFHLLVLSLPLALLLLSLSGQFHICIYLLLVSFTTRFILSFAFDPLSFVFLSRIQCVI